MIKKIASHHHLLSKVICLTLTLLVGGSLLTTGLSTIDRCGAERCCCIMIQPMEMHIGEAKQIQPPTGCCSGEGPPPCELQSKTPFGIPDAAITSGGNPPPQFLTPGGSASNPAGHTTDTGPHFERLAKVQHSQFPPLFLCNQSFLI